MPFAEARGMPPQEVVRSLIEAKVEKIPLLRQLVLELRLTIRPAMMPNDKQIPICRAVRTSCGYDIDGFGLGVISNVVLKKTSPV